MGEMYNNNDNGDMGAQQGGPQPQFPLQAIPFGKEFYGGSSELVHGGLRMYGEKILGSASENALINDIEKEIRKEVDAAIAKANKAEKEIRKEVDEVIAKTMNIGKELRKEVDEAIVKAKNIEKEIRKEVDEAIAKAKNIEKEIRKEAEIVAKAMDIEVFTKEVDEAIAKAKVPLEKIPGDGIDYSIKFKTGILFSSRQNIWDWCLNIALKNGFNLVRASNKQISRKSGMASLYFRCDRSGPSRVKADNPKKRSRKTSTKKCGCPFTLNVVEVRLPGENGTRWITRPNSKTGLHNHVLREYSDGSRGGGVVFTEEEMRYIIEQMKAKVSPAKIMEGLHLNNPEKARCVKKQLYNIGSKMRAKERSGTS